MNLRTPLTLVVSLFILVGLSSCDPENDGLLTENNPNELSTATFYENQTQIEAAVNAVYANLQSVGLYARMYYYHHDIMSNEAEALASLEDNKEFFHTYDASPANGQLGRYWDAYYRGIKRANLAIHNIPESSAPGVSQSLKDRYVAEARFMRAWYYYELVMHWGPVPLYTEPATQGNIEGIPRASQEEVFQVILDDLRFAQDNLLSKSEYSGPDVGRATAGAATALKGFVHLYRSSRLDGVTEWQQAETELEKFTGSGEYASEYSLVENYFDNFKEETENNAESLFEVQFSGTNSADWSEGATGVHEETFRGFEWGFNAWRNTIPSQQLLEEEYSQSDPRYDMNTLEDGELYNNDQDTVSVDDGFTNWRKYQNYYKMATEPPQNSGINFRVIRLADVYLSLADAEIELGNFADARNMMNRVRSRPSVNLPTYGAGDLSGKQDHLDALYHEVAAEHAGEPVLHKFQQRRPQYLEEWATGASEYDPQGVGGEVDGGYSSDCVIIPFPQQEIDANNALGSGDQNSC
jgi:hypothetical protein